MPKKKFVENKNKRLQVNGVQEDTKIEYLTVPILPKNITFIVKDRDNINANSACHTYISEPADFGRLQFHEMIGTCSTRGGDEDVVIEDCRTLILTQLRLKPEDWEVVFTSNATDSLNMATALIYNYARGQKNSFRYYVASTSHNSLYLPAQKQSVTYNHNLELFDTFEKSMIGDSIISMPYIDNLFGFNYWKTYFASKKLSELGVFSLTQSNIIKDTYIILDGAQAGLTLFNPSSNHLHLVNILKQLPRLNCASAIALSGHKFHAPHIGVLVIRKKFLNQDLFKIPEIKIGGGAISYVNPNPNQPSIISNSCNGLEAGLINTESIYGLYYWLLCLASINNNLLDAPKESVFWLKNQINENLSNFQVISKKNFNDNFKNVLSTNSIILLDCGALFASDVNSYLQKNNIESRDGTFCCDLAINKFNLKNLLRLSFDYTFTKIKAEKLYSVLKELNLQVNS